MSPTQRFHRVLPLFLIPLQAAVFIGCSNDGPSAPGSVVVSDAAPGGPSVAFVPGEGVDGMDADLAVAWFDLAYDVVRT